MLAKGHDIANGVDLAGCVQSLVRAFGILDELAQAGGAGLSEIARKVGLPRSTVHRMLTTMEAMRYVEFDRDINQWSVGVKAFTVGTTFVHARDLGSLGRSVMQRLLREVDHSVSLAVPEGSGLCCVSQITARAVPQNVIRPGACLPLHTTASGKAMMAHWSDDEVEAFLERRPLRRRTDQSIMRACRLKDELTMVRERGFAVDDEEHVSGVRCIAAAALDPYGRPRATLSVTDGVARLKRARIAEIGHHIAAAASRLMTA